LIGVWEYANHQGAAEIGFEAVENLQTAFDRAAAVYVVGADPIGDGAIVLKGRRRRPFLLVQDLFETETARAADVVLPAQTYMERQGTFTTGERRVQRFWAAVPALEGTKPDFAITAQVARESGVILEGSSASVVFDIMAAEEDSPFARLSYARLADVHEQWPIVGRGELYYGGTSYENTQGLGVQLLNATQRGEKVSLPRARKAMALRPRDNRLLGVPVTRLYDRARSVASAELLAARIGEAYIAVHPSAAESFGIAEGEHVVVSLDGASNEVIVKVNRSIATGVALIPRSMGLPIVQPTPIRLKSSKKGAAR
jgi:NADH-quinone oxidoreductase subunit G